MPWSGNPTPCCCSQINCLFDRGLRTLAASGLTAIDDRRLTEDGGQNRKGDLAMPDARCPMPDARCPMPDGRCPLPDGRCPTGDGCCPMSSAVSSMADGRVPQSVVL